MYLNNDYSLICNSTDLKHARKKIIKDIIKLCLEHEKACHFIKNSKLNSDGYYMAIESRNRHKLRNILMVLCNITIEEADKKIDNCYKNLNYSIIYKTVSIFIKSYPLIEI